MLEIKTKNDCVRRIREALSSDEAIIPSLPQVLVRVQKAVNDQCIGARELADVILDDPSLTASVLKLANSAYYRHSRTKIRTITSAIVLLGFDTIRNVVLGLSVYNMLSNLPRARNYREVWRHSLCTAVCARQFGLKMRFAVPEEAFVAGLLHDIGKLLLGQFFPEHYAQVINLVSSSDINHVAAERRILKYTHVEAGEQLARHWNFPEEIIDAIAKHELEDDENRLYHINEPLSQSIIISNLVAHMIYDDFPGNRKMKEKTIENHVHNALGIDPDELAKIISQLKDQVMEISRLLDIVIDEWKYDDEKGGGKKSEAEKSAEDRPKLEFLLKANELSLDAKDVNQFLVGTMDTLFGALHINRFFLLFPSRETQCLHAQFGYGANVQDVKNKIAISLRSNDDVAAWAYLNRMPAVVEPGNLHQFARQNGVNLVTLLGTFNLCATPIMVNGKVVAVVVASRDYNQPNFSDEDTRILSIFARNLSTVLVRSREAQ